MLPSSSTAGLAPSQCATTTAPPWLSISCAIIHPQPHLTSLVSSHALTHLLHHALLHLTTPLFAPSYSISLLAQPATLTLQCYSLDSSQTQGQVTLSTLVRHVALLPAPLASLPVLPTGFPRIIPPASFLPNCHTLLHGPHKSGRKSTLVHAAHAASAPLVWFTPEDAWLLDPASADSRLAQAVAQARLVPRAVLVLDQVDLLFAQTEDPALLCELLSRPKPDCCVFALASDLGKVPPLLLSRIDLVLAQPAMGASNLASYWAQLAAPAHQDALVRASAGLGLFECTSAVWQCGLDDVDKLVAALNRARPRALADGPAWSLVLPSPDGPFFRDVCGQREAKQALLELALWPRTRQAQLSALGLKPPRGLLLSGPPGTGKTLLARALANEARINLVLVSLADLIRGDVGETEKLVAQLFAAAKASAPCVCFFDEAQALLSANPGDVSRRLVGQFAAETDALSEGDGVVLLAATNVAALVDPGLVRRGRLERVVHVGLLDAVQDRVAMLERLAWGSPVDLVALALELGPQSGATLEALIRRAKLEADMRGDSCVDRDDWRRAVQDLL